MATILLDDLAVRISQQEAQLQALRRDLETRQRQLSDLSQQRQRLLTQLQRIDVQIAEIANGSQSVKASQPKTAQAKPGRSVVIGKHAGNGVTTKQTVGKASSKGIPPKAKVPKGAQAGQHSLPGLIVTLLREAGGPLTVKQLAEGAKRRRFRSSSGNFSKMLAVRARELKRKGVVQGAVGQPGFVLAQSNSRSAKQSRQAAHQSQVPTQKTGKSAKRKRAVAGRK